MTTTYAAAHWQQAWQLAIDLFPGHEMHETGDDGYDYAGSVITYSAGDDPTDEWYQNANTLVSLFELGHWLGRAMLSAEYTEARLMRTFKITGPLSMVTDEMALAAIQEGHAYGKNIRRYGQARAWRILQATIS